MVKRQHLIFYKKKIIQPETQALNLKNQVAHRHTAISKWSANIWGAIY